MIQESAPVMFMLSIFQRSKLDFAVAFGGDGTLLYTSSIFPAICPPVIAFGLGTLSFLPPFGSADMVDVLTKVWSLPRLALNPKRCSACHCVHATMYFQRLHGSV